MSGTKKWILPLLAALLVCLMLAGCGQGAASSSTSQAEEKERYVMVEITMQDGGVIKLQLDREAAPITVDNFEKLVSEGFYDGLTFHRAVDGFMIQGGDPNGTGTGGSKEQIKGEFAQNGWDNPISHARGVISMARSQNPDSASSQFFITNGDATFLDGSYAAFGTVTEGMDVVDAIAKMPTSGESLVTQPVMEKVVIIEDAE